jgi:hypothetical protein
VNGVFAPYLSPGMPVIVDLMGDGASLGLDPPYCPPGHGSHDWVITGATLRAGDLVYASNNGGVLERNNENGACGSQGGPLRAYIDFLGLMGAHTPALDLEPFQIEFSPMTLGQSPWRTSSMPSPLAMASPLAWATDHTPVSSRSRDR